VADQVPVCWSYDFNWTGSYVYTCIVDCNAIHYENGPLATICSSALITAAVFMPLQYSAEYVVPTCK
jgi:hypothetical protein